MPVRVVSWELPDDYTLPGSDGTKGFSVPSGPTKTWINGTSGIFAQASWTFSIRNGTSTPWSFQAPAATAVGSNNQVPAQIIHLAAGEYTFHWAVEGHVSELSISAETHRC